MMKIRTKYVAVLLMICVMCGWTVPVQAANKFNVTEIKKNTVQKIQLDGKGAKEKVELTVVDKKVTKEKYSSTVTLTINGAKVFKNSYCKKWGPVEVELVETDIDTSDRQKDLFLAVYNCEWAGTYMDLIRVTYQDGKVSVDDLLDTLKKVKSPKLKQSDKDCDMSHRGYEVNPIESCEGLIKGDLIAPGDGTVKWHTCLFTGNADFFHGYIILTLESGKLQAADYPSGTIVETGVSGKLKKSITIYERAGSSKKVITVAAGKTIRMKEYRYVDQKLYVKVKYGTHYGWVPQSELGSLEWDGVMHA